MSTLQARPELDREGAIRSIEADPDTTRRPDPEATIGILRELL